jgi:Zn-dependent peptidase ImmA (M78 family)
MMKLFLTPQQVEQRVIGLVAHARRRYGIPEGCTGEEACRLLKLRFERGRIASGADGMWVDDHIVVNHSLSWTPRIEFTTFHEIMHYLLDDDGDLIEYFTRTLRNDKDTYEAAIERCCHQGAAEFLMPRARVREAIAAEGFSAALVERIARRYGASAIAAAIQLALSAPINCFIVLCGDSPMPGARPSPTGLHVEYACAPWRQKYTLARFTPIPRDHPLHQAWRTKRRVEGRSYVPFRSGKCQPCDCEAVPLGGRVVGILALERPVPREQLAMPFDSADVSW